MREVWLRSNPRAVWPGLGTLAVVALGGLSFWLLARHYAWGQFQELVGLSLPIIALGVASSLVALARLPRLASEGDEMLVYLGQLQPLRVPLEIVEVFFKGQTAAQPTTGPTVKISKPTPSRTSTIVVRLAEAATDWQQRTVNQRIGKWEDGYIILHGTWCEPITNELIKHLNSRLVAAHRQRRGEPPLATSGTPPCHPAEHAECQSSSQCEATGQCEMLAEQLRRFLPANSGHKK